MKMMRALFLLLIAGLPLEQGLCNERTAEVTEVIALADAAVASAGVRPRDLELVTAKKYSTPFNEIVRKNSPSAAQQALAKRLTNRTYWMIYYRSRITDLGGDVGIFVDATSKEVIHVYKGR